VQSFHWEAAVVHGVHDHPAVSTTGQQPAAFWSEEQLSDGPHVLLTLLEAHAGTHHQQQQQQQQQSYKDT
jgi:hypothetical protein